MGLVGPAARGGANSARGLYRASRPDGDRDRAMAAGLRASRDPAADCHRPASDDRRDPFANCHDPSAADPGVRREADPVDPGGSADRAACAADGRDALAAGGRGVPAVGGREVPAVVGREAPAAGGRDAPAAGGRDALAAGGRDALAAGGRGVPAVGGREVPAVGGREAPAAGGRDALAVGGRDAPAAGGRGMPAAVGRVPLRRAIAMIGWRPTAAIFRPLVPRPARLEAFPRDPCDSRQVAIPAGA